MRADGALPHGGKYTRPMITADILLTIPLFAKLPQHERESIAEKAADIDLSPGEWLVSEGEVTGFFGLVSGKLEALKGAELDSRRIAVLKQGETFGETPLLLDSPANASVRAMEHSRVLRLDPTDFRELIQSCPALNTQIVETMTKRVAALQKVALERHKVGLTIVGPRWHSDCHDVRDFLSRNHVEFIWLDPADNDARARIPPELCDAPLYPVMLFEDGRRLVAPSLRTLAEAVNLRTVPAADDYDVAIIGAGPAGLGAAVYAASEGLSTVIFEREVPGGQAGTSSWIENYLGFPTGLSGDDLGRRALNQATRFGADIIVARGVRQLDVGAHGAPNRVVLDDGTSIRAKAVVIATGVAWRSLNAPGVSDLTGRGVYYGAARSEALGTRGKRIHLIGGGNSAGQAAMFFSNFADVVTILVRGAGLSATMSQYLIDQLAIRPNVTIETHTELVRANGTEHLTGLELRDTRDDSRRTVDSDALFIFIGADAETSWLPDTLVRDKLGYICTGRDIVDIIKEQGLENPWPDQRDPYLLETSVPGIFAAGDVRHGSIKRIASGVGEGSMTVAFVHQYLLSLQDETAPARR
jgi:thioredoxin reductase (NADPH)